MMILTPSWSYCQADTTVDHIFVSDVFGIGSADSSIHFNQFQSSISDFQELDIREAPGTIHIITAEQIQSMGSNDLMDVLAFLPSVSLGRDVDDVIGLGIRGLWAHEGKVLYMINGIPLNDLDFGSFALGSRLSLDNVSRIEVMTGPGSALYGGTAALGVINIITKQASETKGMKFIVESSYSKGFLNRNGVSLALNEQVGKETFVSFQASFKNSLRSTYSEIDSDTVSLSYGDSTQVTDQFMYLGITRKNMRTQLFFNEYLYQLSEDNYSILMKTLAWDTEWKYKVSNKLKGRTRLTYLNQLPWFNLNNLEEDLMATNTQERKISLSSIVDGKIGTKISFNGGVQGYYQRGQILHRGFTWSINERNVIGVGDLALHSEINYRSKLGIWKLGARAEKNSLAPLLIAPRFAWNLVKGNFFAKLLFSSAFKIPTIQNVNLGPVDEELKNELVQTNELTLGYQSGKNATAQVTLFQTSIQNPIVYVFDSLLYDNYINRKRCGSYGLELRYFFKSQRTQFQGGLSVYRPSKNTDMPEIIAIENPSRAYLGLASFKTSFSLKYKVGEAISLYSALNYQGELESSHDYGDGYYESEVHPATIILNSGIIIRPVRMNNLQCHFGVNNILDNALKVASPYAGDLKDLPIMARQFQVSLTYKLK
jgi:outer membrane receptor protein involved in Fe transport